MTLRKFLLWFLFVFFAAYSTWAMWQVGYFGIWQSGFATVGSLQILFDLVVCCLLITSWLIKDAKTRGVNPYPWVIATFATGSLAPLVYLIIREHRKTKHDIGALPQH